MLVLFVYFDIEGGFKDNQRTCLMVDGEGVKEIIHVSLREYWCWLKILQSWLILEEKLEDREIDIDSRIPKSQTLGDHRYHAFIRLLIRRCPRHVKAYVTRWMIQETINIEHLSMKVKVSS